MKVIKAGEIDRNVKLGRGGIREIEFIVQTQQILRAGKSPFLQGNQTLPMLATLSKYHLLPSDDVTDWPPPTVFCVILEHRLQMEATRQTHTIPQTGMRGNALRPSWERPSLIALRKTGRAHSARPRNL